MSNKNILANSPSIIYQPGGVAGGLVVTSWAQVKKFITARQGACVVFVDDSITSPALVPGGTGITDFFGRGEIRPANLNGNTPPVLVVQDGATIKGLARITGAIELEGDSRGVTPSFDWDFTAVGAEPTFFIEDNASFGTTATATNPIVNVPAGKTLFVSGQNEATLNVGGASVIFNVPAGATLAVSLSDAAIFGSPYASGAGTVDLFYDSPSLFFMGGVVPPLPGIGTYSTTNVDASTGAVQAVDFAVGLISTSSVTLLPPGAIVLRALVQVSVPYSPGATIEIGQAGTPALLQTTADNNPQVADLYDSPQRTPWGGTALAVLVTIAGAPIAGSGNVTVEYSLPTA